MQLLGLADEFGGVPLNEVDGAHSFLGLGGWLMLVCVWRTGLILLIVLLLLDHVVLLALGSIDHIPV